MKLIYLFIAIIVLFILLLILEAFIARSGGVENFTNPERTIKKYGTTGKALNYMVLGDSTSAGQGADYQDGIAVSTAKHLSKKYTVSMLNTSISGAIVKDVLNDQIKLVQDFKPDIVLISAGANDVTNLTSPSTLQKQLQEITTKVIASNCNVKIVLTASPDMGNPPRLPQPLRWITGLYSQHLNKTFFLLFLKMCTYSHHVMLLLLQLAFPF